MLNNETGADKIIWTQGKTNLSYQNICKAFENIKSILEGSSYINVNRLAIHTPDIIELLLWVTSALQLGHTVFPINGEMKACDRVFLNTECDAIVFVANTKVKFETLRSDFEMKPKQSLMQYYFNENGQVDSIPFEMEEIHFYQNEIDKQFNGVQEIIIAHELSFFEMYLLFSYALKNKIHMIVATDPEECMYYENKLGDKTVLIVNPDESRIQEGPYDKIINYKTVYQSQSSKLFASMDSAKCLQYKNLIINNGRRFSLRGIEKVYETYIGIDQAAVIINETRQRLSGITLFYTGTNQDIDLKQMQEFTAFYLPLEFIANKAVRLSELPYDVTGQVYREKLIDRKLDETGLECNDKIAADMLDIINKEFDKQLSLSDLDTKLSELGINSLTFIEMAVFMEDHFNFEFEDEMLDINLFTNLHSVAAYITMEIEKGK